MSLSWLPFSFNFSLPDLAPPLSIQRRFISFLLKRSLGHLLKPGQLDINQIDAQIGNGFVEVKDLELDSDAINSFLGGQPVQLHSGTIGTVTARVPWPNPFSSTVGLSLSGLRLDFRLAEGPEDTLVADLADELAESVASVAESFIHSELTATEEAQLRQSIHQDQGPINDIPGFMGAPLCRDDEGPRRHENDPEGVSMFARLFETLLARFDFDASDSQTSLIHGDVTLTISIGRIHYFTAAGPSEGEGSGSQGPGTGERRSVHVSGVKITMHDQSQTSPQPVSPTTFQTRTQPEGSNVAQESSDSEIDDETHALMSQSLAFLPPRPSNKRPPSPPSDTASTSPASSIYKSAISETGPLPPTPPIGSSPPSKPRSFERTIFSIAEPVIFQLTTPAVAPSEPSGDPDTPLSSSEKERMPPSENMKLEVSLGIITTLLDARCIHGLVLVADAVMVTYQRRPPKTPTRSNELGAGILDRLDISTQLKGLVAVVLGESLEGTQDEPSLTQFFEHPLRTPRMAGGYVRFHVDLVQISMKTDDLRESHSVSTPVSQSPSSSSPLSKLSTSSRQGLAHFTIADFSILVFHPSQSDNSGGEGPNPSSPLLVTDRHLDSSYHIPSLQPGARADRHTHPYSDNEKSTSLPTIDVMQWYSEQTRSQGASLRRWKTRPGMVPHRRRTSGAGLVSNIGISSSPTRVMSNPLAIDVPALRKRDTPAVSAQLRLGRNGTITSIEIETTALHVFLDLELARSMTQFIEDALPDAGRSAPTELPSPVSTLSQDTDSDGGSESGITNEERRRLEKLVLDDLNLDLDYRRSGGTTPKQGPSPQRIKTKGRRAKPQSTTQVDVLFPLIRVEIRAPPPPPPPNRSPRSGALVLDIHSARFCKLSSRSHDYSRVPRFETGSEDHTGLEDWFSGGSRSRPISLEMKRVIVAYAALGQSTALTVFSLGPVGGPESQNSHLLPLVFFRNSESSGDQTSQTDSNALVARIPSLHAVVNKTSLDGLQLWVDDLSQCIERLTRSVKSGISTRAQVSRTGSLIGSRYFIRRSGSSTESEMESTVNHDTAKSELVIKFCLSEAFLRFDIPSTDNSVVTNRILELCTSDLDALIEFKPEGKDETVVSLNVNDMSVKNSSSVAFHDVVAASPLSTDGNKPAVFRLRFRSVSIPGTVAKESKVRMVLNGLTINLWSDVTWVNDLLSFIRAPPGAFESVIPSERTQISINILDCACRATPPSRSSALVLSLGDVNLSTDLVDQSHETALGCSISALSVLLNDDSDVLGEGTGLGQESDVGYWVERGYALLTTIQNLELRLEHSARVPSNTQVTLRGMILGVHLCADSISGIAGFINDLQTILPAVSESTSDMGPRRPTRMYGSRSSTLLRSLDESAFTRQPVIGPLPDMVDDDLPRNPEYLDASFGAAAGLRPLEDDDEEFFAEANGRTAEHGGETIKMFHSPIEIIENYFDTLTPSPLDFAAEHGETAVRIRANDCNIHLFLHDGYDWERTRKAIREEVKRVRRRLAKIKQLLASGQTYDPTVEEVNSVLFNSVYVGLETEAEDLEGTALIDAIDEELADDASDVVSDSSWQSFKPERRPRPGTSKSTSRKNKMSRARDPSVEFSLRGLTVDFDQYLPDAGLASRLLSTIKDLEILDHMKTSTWSTFLTGLRTDSRGNIRETDSNMVRIELQMLQPFRDHHEQEARLKAKILPLRLHVDQDALDFLKKFFSFKDGDAEPSPPPENEIFFQHVEIFPIDIKLDYKPRRVDYKALKEGRTIELMNFFHFDGSEMTLRHLTLKGVTGWARMFDLLNDLWTPDVKANQLVDVISGVSPIRSAVNVGSGIADLVLLPIAQYKKDGRIIRGLQKGATAFMKSTAMEAIKLGARLATGTQVVLEQTENVLGAQFSGPVTAEALQTPVLAELPGMQSGESDTSAEELYSRYAEQPTNVREGVQSAYRSLSENIKYAGQTILAVPMEVYERSGTEGPARAVIRAVPIAVLKPMIGASEAVSKTLLGLHNTLDPQAQIETETKYKHR